MDINASILTVIARVSAPILLCASGAIYCELSGVTNITMEGAMLIAAFTGVAGSFFTHSIIVGVVFALLGSLFVNLFFGVLHLRLGGEPTVTGFAINILCAGLSTFLLRTIFNVSGTLTDPGIVGMSTFSIPLLKDIPILGNFFMDQTFAVYFSWIFIIFTYVFIYKTRIGMNIRACGENPMAASTIGVSVMRMRWIGIVVSGVLSGLAGAQLSLGYLSLFSENMTAGRGFIALAAIILAKAKPMGVFAAVLAFGFAEAIANQAQLTNVSSHLVLMIPYIMVVLVLLVQPEQMRLFFTRLKNRRKKEVAKKS